MEPEITAEVLRTIFFDIVPEVTPTDHPTRKYRSHDAHSKDAAGKETRAPQDMLFGTYTPKKQLSREQELEALFTAKDKQRSRADLER